VAVKTVVGTAALAVDMGCGSLICITTLPTLLPPLAPLLLITATTITNTLPITSVAITSTTNIVTSRVLRVAAAAVVMVVEMCCFW